MFDWSRDAVYSVCLVVILLVAVIAFLWAIYDHSFGHGVDFALGAVFLSDKYQFVGCLPQGQRDLFRPLKTRAAIIAIVVVIVVVCNVLVLAGLARQASMRRWLLACTVFGVTLSLTQLGRAHAGMHCYRVMPLLPEIENLASTIRSGKAGSTHRSGSVLITHGGAPGEFVYRNADTAGILYPLRPSLGPLLWIFAPDGIAISDSSFDSEGNWHFFEYHVGEPNEFLTTTGPGGPSYLFRFRTRSHVTGKWYSVFRRLEDVGPEQ